jgi:hypothetical protein
LRILPLCSEVSYAAAAVVLGAALAAAAASESSCESMAVSLETIKADLDVIKGALGVSELETAAKVRQPFDPIFVHGPL